MNLSTVAVLAVVVLIVALIIRSIVKDKKNGKSLCGGNCQHCGGACSSCHSPKS
jgi:hypothetical protein